MVNALKHLAVDVAGAVGVAAATINNLHGALRLLARDHRRIQTLLGYTLHGDTSSRAAFWQEARQTLLTHERAEMDEVIAALHPAGRYQGLVARHMEEVHRLEQKVDEIDAAEVGSAQWHSALADLNQLVRNHVFEEEGELFHWIESDLGRDGLDAAASRLQAAQQQAIPSTPPEITPPVGPPEVDLPPIEPPEPEPPPAVPPGPQEPPMEPPGPTKPPVRPPGPTPPPAKV